MTPTNRALLVLLSIMAAALVLIARQQVGAETQTVTQPVSAPVADAQDIMGTQSLQTVAQTAEIASLKRELHDVELTSRSVGLLSLKPGNWRNGWMATFYDGSAGLNGSGTGITASGQAVANDWTCAADTSILPLGTLIEVQVHGQAPRILQVDDRGSAIKGRRLDIYVPNKAECMKLGRQRVRIRILRMG